MFIFASSQENKTRDEKRLNNMIVSSRRIKPTSERARARLQTLNKVLKAWDKARAEYPEASNNKIIIFISFALGLNNNTVRSYLYEAERIKPRFKKDEAKSTN